MLSVSIGLCCLTAVQGGCSRQPCRLWVPRGRGTATRLASSTGCAAPAVPECCQDSRLFSWDFVIYGSCDPARGQYLHLNGFSEAWLFKDCVFLVVVRLQTHAAVVPELVSSPRRENPGGSCLVARWNGLGQPPWVVLPGGSCSRICWGVLFCKRRGSGVFNSSDSVFLVGFPMNCTGGSGSPSETALQLQGQQVRKPPVVGRRWLVPVSGTPCTGARRVVPCGSCR